MATEVWFRDPHNYVRELVECEAGLIAWNRGTLQKRRIDPVAWADLYFGPAIKVRQLLVGPQGTAEIGPGRGLEKPLAVYSTWDADTDIAFLESMMETNIGDEIDACVDGKVPIDERPVFGQEHRVVATNLPKVNTGPGRATIRRIKELQEEYPDCILMVHGLYSFKYQFGMGFGAADVEPRTAAANGRVILASGGEMDYKRAQTKANWITAVGMKPADLDVPRNRCIYNIKSAIWAGENYLSFDSPRMIKRGDPDYKAPKAAYVAPTGPAWARGRKPKEGDMTLCDSCSLSDVCKQYRESEVCSVPEGNAGELARFFNTRDSQTVVDGLSILLQIGARRLENAVGEEDALGITNPEVGKMMNSLFSQGVTFAKLIDPTLRSAGVKVQVGVVNGTATAAVSTGGTPHELVGEVMRSLERSGIPRDKITPDLVMATIKGMSDPEARTRAIEGTVIAENG